MKLKQYSANIVKLAVKYPDLELVYATDDEGNGYCKVNFDPGTLGNFQDGEFLSEDDFEDSGLEVNSICVN